MTVVMVLAEIGRGQVRDVSYELISAGRHLKGQGGARLVVGVVAHNASAAADAFRIDGVDEIIAVPTPTEHFEAHVADLALEALIADVAPDIVLLGHTVDSLGFAPATAAKGGLGFASDAVAIELEEGRPVIRRTTFGERLVAEVDFPGHERVIVLVRAGSYEATGSADGSVKTRTLSVSFAPKQIATEHLGFREPEIGDVDITRSDFLLSVGRGVDDQEHLERLERLAGRLGATLCVSRPLVDAGWAPASLQVGQSGKTVKPRIYLALGISGAVQHLAGMSKADTIIAVNTDADAPIFGAAHYGAVIDLFDVVDELEERVGAI